MTGPRIALVCRDPALRLRAARAFDDAPLEWTVQLFETAPPDADVIVRAPGVSGDGIELDLEHPAATITRIEASLGERSAGEIIEVVSAGGGAGCTSVALHLAAFMSGSEPALYLESRSSCGGRLRLGLDEDGPSWSGIEESRAVGAATLPLPDGLRGLFAASEPEPVPAEIVDLCRKRFPFVVIDRGPCEWVPLSGSKTVIVIAPSVPSARKARAALQRGGTACAVVTNRVGPGSEITDRAIEAILERRLTLALPCSPSLRDSEDSGRLLTRSSTAWSRRLGLLADALAGS